MTDVVRFIKLTDCAPLAKIFQEQVRCLCSAFAVFTRHSGPQTFCRSRLLRQAQAGAGARRFLVTCVGGGKVWGTHIVSTDISLGGSLLLSRDGSPSSPLGLLKVASLLGVRAWCHLAKSEV